MYERFYNLRERPFALSPDPEYLYLSKAHSEALDSIRYGIESRAGFTVVTGEIGAGKTTLLKSVLQRLDDRTVIALSNDVDARIARSDCARLRSRRRPIKARPGSRSAPSLNSDGKAGVRCW
jgi:type II secretory pathway predicted ATPase ExeA